MNDASPHFTALLNDLPHTQRQSFIASLFDNSHDGIVLTAPDGQIIEVNQRYQQMTGRSRDTLRGYNFKFTHRNTLLEDKPATEWNLLLAQGTAEVQGVKRDQGTRYIRQLDMMTLAATDTHPACYLIFIRDITAERLSEAALKESESSISQIVESFPQPIMVLNKAHVITHWNHAAEVIFDAPREEMIGTRNQWKPFYPNARPVMADLVLDQQEAGLIPKYYANKFSESKLLPGAYEATDFFPTMKPKGRWLYFTAMALRNPQGDIIGAVESLIDITEQKCAEAEVLALNNALEERIAQRTLELEQAMAQLVQTEKLASLGSLVAGVAHELNTPLGNMLTLATTLQEHAQAFSATIAQGQLKRSTLDNFLSMLQESTQLFESSAHKASDLISSFKQVAVDQSSSRRRPFSLQQTINEVLMTLRPLLKNSLHQIHVDIPQPIEMNSYPGPLEQVLTNLINNSLIHAFDHDQPGDIVISAEQHDNLVTLIYRDNGQGMSEDVQKKLFDPFFTTRMGSGGSGLGMYITYNLVNALLGGQIHVQSHPGQGSTFTLCLPIHAPDEGNSDEQLG